MTIVDVCAFLATLLVVTLAATEFKKWFDARVRAAGRAYPLSQLIRRIGGVVVLIGSLAFARLAFRPDFSVRMQFRFLLIALLLCVVVLLIVVWDFRALRRRAKSEMKRVAAKSVQELRVFAAREIAKEGEKGADDGAREAANRAED